LCSKVQTPTFVFGDLKVQFKNLEKHEAYVLAVLSQEPSWLCPTHVVVPPRGRRCPAPRLPPPTAGGHVLGPCARVRPDALSSRAPSTPHFAHHDNSAAAPHVHRVTAHGAPPAEPPLVAGLSCHCNGTRRVYDTCNPAPHLGNTRPTVRPVRKPVRRLSLCSVAA